MPACCPCKSNGVCKSCVCVKSGRVCRDCAAGKAGRCQNHSKHVEHSDVHGITDLLQNRKDETIVEEMLNENTKMETGLSGLNTGLSTLIGEETTNSSQTPNRGEAVPIGAPCQRGCRRNGTRTPRYEDRLSLGGRGRLFARAFSGACEPSSNFTYLPSFGGGEGSNPMERRTECGGFSVSGGFHQRCLRGNCSLAAKPIPCALWKSGEGLCSRALSPLSSFWRTQLSGNNCFKSRDGASSPPVTETALVFPRKGPYALPREASAAVESGSD